nr:peptidase M4 [Candidatus Pantoea persica]
MSYSVIPPYMLRNIVTHGSGHQQDYARRTLMHVQHLMAENWQKPVAPRNAVGGHVEHEIYDAKNTQNLQGDLLPTIFSGKPISATRSTTKG